MTAELVDRETGEVISYGRARESIDEVNRLGARCFDLMLWQIENQVWTVLGYDSWDEMRDAEYAGLKGVIAPREDRPELVSRLRAQGWTQQQIADNLGVSQRTVSGDLNSNSANEAAQITNSRGQQRPATYQRREPDPEPEWTSARTALDSINQAIADDTHPQTPAGEDPPAVQDPQPAPPRPPAPLSPSPEAVRRHEAEQAEQTSREVGTRNIALAVWHLAEAAGHRNPVRHIVDDWQPDADHYPKPTTAARMRAAANLLNALASEWHQ